MLGKVLTKYSIRVYLKLVLKENLEIKIIILLKKHTECFWKVLAIVQ